jgi:hypothetical protein
MPPDLESSIRFLEENNDPTEAFFSYTVDDTGEYCLIKANKEGLRLYAAELLRQSQLLEQKTDRGLNSELGLKSEHGLKSEQPEGPLFFAPQPWMVSETGYDLIAGILPQYEGRRSIVSQWNPIRRSSAGRRPKPVFLFVVMCITGALIMLATLKTFSTLRLWVNIH